MKKFLVYGLVLVLLTTALTGCGGAGHTTEVDSNVHKIRIAQQYGLVYAPLMLAQKKGFFEKYGLEVEWKRYGSGGAAREALASGELDVAFMGIPPFLLGWDRGVPAKVAAGYVVSPVSLVTYNPAIKTIKDFNENHKIALPSPGSVQHILLSMALEKEVGDPRALDDILVALPHPDGASAMLAKKDIDAHFTTPPYLFEELSHEGYVEVLKGAEAFGREFSFNVGVVTQSYHDNNPQGYAAFVQGLKDAVTWLNQHKREAAKVLAPEFNLPEEKVYEYLTWPGMNYTTTPYGLMGFARYMKKAGYIEKVPQDITDIVYENVAATIGKREGSPGIMEELQWRE